MALINDPDQLNDSPLDDASAEVFINTATRRIKLNAGVGNLVAADGVVEKALASFIKEEWKSDPHSKGLIGIPYPLEPITDEFFQLKNGWDWEDSSTEILIRRGGWEVLNASGQTIKHFAGVALLEAESDDVILFDNGNGATAFAFPGNTAEAIQVIDDPNGDGSYVDGFDRSANVNVYNREQGQLFSIGSSQANGESTLLAPKLFSLSVPTGVDGNISASDVTISGTAPWNGMSITFFDTLELLWTVMVAHDQKYMNFCSGRLARQPTRMPV